MLRLETISNKRTANGDKFTTDIVCEVCNKPTIAYLSMVISLDELNICKGCLNKGIKLVDEQIMEDTRREYNETKRIS